MNARLLFITDGFDEATPARVGADGAHLPARGLPPKPARRVVTAAGMRAPFWLGASTHSLEELRMAGGADYVVFGPVYETASKPEATPVGLARLAEAVRASPAPVFALGGIDAARARECNGVGARVACIGAVLGAGDPGAGARALAQVFAVEEPRA